MARIAHLSDVHFGAHDAAVVAGAEAWLAAEQPELVVISGDFTQRATVRQYREAGAFLDRLEAAGLKTLGVPGNHDVPFYDLVQRFTRPLHRYRRYIDDDLCPWFESERLAVLGWDGSAFRGGSRAGFAYDGEHWEAAAHATAG